MAKTRFKLECEIEVEYPVQEGTATTPYTHVGSHCKNGSAEIIAKEGKITKIELKKLVRLEEKNKNE